MYLIRLFITPIYGFEFIIEKFRYDYTVSELIEESFDIFEFYKNNKGRNELLICGKEYVYSKLEHMLGYTIDECNYEVETI